MLQAFSKPSGKWVPGLLANSFRKLICELAVHTVGRLIDFLVAGYGKNFRNKIRKLSKEMFLLMRITPPHSAPWRTAEMARLV